MKFGKLQDVSHVNFNLPEIPSGTELILQHLPERKNPPKVFIGATGWGMKEWVGKWYPKGTTAKGYLKAYGKQFNTIELNTTHYRIPQATMIDKWCDETPSDFVFCPKIPQSISHRRDMGLSGEKIEIFSREIKGLGSKMGCCFMQMPPYFKEDRLPILERFLSEWDMDIPLALEVRHEDWFRTQESSTSLFKMLEKYNISTVITDVAGRRDVLHMRLTTPIAMIRFVGNGLIDSDYSRIEEWVQTLKKWVDKGLQEVYFFTHEPDNILAPELAQYLTSQTEKHIPNAQVRGPKPLENQMTLF